jgi:CheY-like chemotaxis protein
MDLSLPLLDGLAATRRIRQHAELRDVPIVAVSAHDTADFHADALAAGCNDYVTKPIDFDQLEALLNRLLPKNSKQ